MRRPKILVSAIACEPYGASESLHGWHVCHSLPALRGSAIITSQRALAERFGLTPESYAAAIHGKITGSAVIAQKVSLGLEHWLLIAIDPDKAGNP